MTTECASAADDPRWLLSTVSELAARVPRTHSATWFPLLAIAAITFAAIPVCRYGHYALTCDSAASHRICSAYSVTAFVYWPIALLLAYAAIAVCYIRVSRQRGVGTRVRPYVLAGM